MLTGVNRPAASSKPPKYYTTPTSSVVDNSGNVTNYYRSGDTTNTKIIDSYNKTFNTIHNTTNNTNNYQANVKLSDFLNNYTTNNITNTTNNKYTYSADFNSWYYDNTTNNYNYNYTSFTKNDYTQNNLYYNQDNSRYYISIDNSTDEYYLVDVQYSPTFVTVNYTYNTTNNNYEKATDDIKRGWSSVNYRVRAYDAYNATSAYVTGTAQPVNNNHAPAFTCNKASGADLGKKNAGFSITYSVGDEDGDPVTVTEAIDGVTLRTFSANLGGNNTFAVTGDTFFKLLNGAHTLTASANDGQASVNLEDDGLLLSAVGVTDDSLDNMLSLCDSKDGLNTGAINKELDTYWDK